MHGPEEKPKKIDNRIEAIIKVIIKDLDKKKHLSDIEFLNQNARGK